MKNNKNLTSGIIVIACAVALIALGVLDSVLTVKISLTRTLFALILLTFTVFAFIKKHFFIGFMFLAFTFFTAEKDIAILCGIKDGDIVSNSLIYLAAILLGAGTSMIYNTVRYRKFVKNFTSSFGGNNFGGFGFGNGSFSGFGAGPRTVSANSLDGYRISSNRSFSQITVTDGDEYTGDATVYINGNTAVINLRVPPSWHIVINDAEPEDLAGVSIRPQNGTPGKMLYLSIKNNSGSINIIS